MNLLLVSRPWLAASRAIEADRVMSSYEEFVQEPIRATFNSAGQPFFTTSSLNLEMGVARSGVKGPLICGSKSERFYKEKRKSVTEKHPWGQSHNINDLIVLCALIRAQVVCESLGIFGDIGAFGRIQIVRHASVKWEERSCRTNFRTHIADCGHTSRGEAFYTRTLVFDDGTSTTLDRKNTSNLEDDICE